MSTMPVERAGRARDVHPRARARPPRSRSRVRVARRYGGDGDPVDVGVLPPREPRDLVEAEPEQALAQRRRRDRARHGGGELVQRGARRSDRTRRSSPAPRPALARLRASDRAARPGASACRRGTTGRPAAASRAARGRTCRAPRGSRRDRRPTGERSIGVAAGCGEQARQQSPAQRRGEDGERAEPGHAAPSWRRPSKSTTATAVARFRLRTCGLESGMREDRVGVCGADRVGQPAALAAEHQDVVGLVAHRGVRARRACREAEQASGRTSPPGTHPSSASGGDRRAASSRARRDADACRRSRSRAGSTRWSGVAVATHRRPIEPVFGGISGATSTTCTTRSAGCGRERDLLAGRTQHACAVRGPAPRVA